MRKFILFLAITAIVSCSQSNTQVITHMTAAEVQEKLSDETYQVIDVRTPEEYKIAAVENSIKINFRDKDFQSKIEKLDKEKPVIVYCKAGGRSVKAAKLMEQVGFKSVINVSDVYDAISELN